MSKRFFGSLTLSISCALLLAACGGSETTTNSTNATAANKTATTTTTTTTTSTPATTTSTPMTTGTPATTTTAASGGKIGVPECDEYLTKYEACISGKVPAAARAQYEAGLEQSRTRWRELAANPQARATLAQVCKMATDQSRQTMKSLGCDF